MHDRFNRELKEGDLVLIPARVVELNSTADFCNVTVETIFGRRPDGQQERISAINTRVLVRADFED